jgi:hypothetical protein
LRSWTFEPTAVAVAGEGPWLKTVTEKVVRLPAGAVAGLTVTV